MDERYIGDRPLEKKKSLLENEMSEIQNILRLLKNTREEEILVEMEKSFENISIQQSEWYKKSEFFCSSGCGECCRDFEPDLLECEALYMAAWLLENQPEVAKKIAEGIFPYPRFKGCQFWIENQSYHCSIYGGRAFICRLFGACGNKNKDGEIVFKPCKFYSADRLAQYKIPLSHRQYSKMEIEEIFGILPPVMSDLMELSLSFNPGTQKTELIRDILPKEVRKLQWIISRNNKENYTES